MRNFIGVFVLLFVPMYAVSPVTADEAKPVPYIANGDDTDGVIFGGDKGDRGRPGDRGLKPIDPPKFDLPSPFSIAGGLIGIVISIVSFVVQLAIIALVAWVVFRAVKRHKDTGSVIPAKGEKTIFDLFDEAVTELKARRTDRQKELAEIDKRLPSESKTK